MDYAKEIWKYSHLISSPLPKGQGLKEKEE